MVRCGQAVWDRQAMETLGTLREYEAVLLGGGAERACGLGLAAHARQTAEACRLAHPAAPWLQLAGLLHPLGKLLAHPRCARPPGCAGGSGR